MGRRIPRMGTPTPQLAAHKGLRGQILLELKRAQPVTAKALAEKLRVSPNAIRHHLKELEAEQLVTYGREQRGVGAPTYAYSLSPEGESLFPRQYERALTDVLERLAEKAGRETAVKIFREHYADLTRQMTTRLAGLPAEQRLAGVAGGVSEAGDLAGGQGAGGTGRPSGDKWAV